MCLYPKLIPNPKYKATKKNGGNIPPVYDERVKLLPIGCGNCIECRKAKQREWQVRLLEDIKTNTNGKFITLTLSTEHYKQLYHLTNHELEPYDIENQLITIATRRFLERWRKKYKKSLRHWLVSELGHQNTEHVHLHGIIWTNENPETINKIWHYGYTWQGYNKKGQLINYVNSRTVNYCTKYISKVDLDHKYYKSIILTSPAIGKNYTSTYNSKNNKYNGTKTDETYRTAQGYKMSMPIYWRNKIYSETEREQLWLHKLDKQERWVCGERIDISKTEEQYYKLLEWHRRKNKELKYGSDEIDWKRKHYENQRRLLIQKARIHQANNKAKPHHDCNATDTTKPALLHRDGYSVPPRNNNYDQQYELVKIGNNTWAITEQGIKNVDN